MAHPLERTFLKLPHLTHTFSHITPVMSSQKIRHISYTNQKHNFVRKNIYFKASLIASYCIITRVRQSGNHTFLSLQTWRCSKSTLQTLTVALEWKPVKVQLILLCLHIDCLYQFWDFRLQHIVGSKFNFLNYFNFFSFPDQAFFFSPYHHFYIDLSPL